MVKRISIEDFKKHDAYELVYHMSVQSLLDLKSIHGRVDVSDVLEAVNLSVFCKSVFFGTHLAYIVIGIPSSDSGQTNMFLYATTEGYSKISMVRESIFSLINDLRKDKICSMVYKGNKKLQALLKANGFEYSKSLCFGKENRTFCLFVRE